MKKIFITIILFSLMLVFTNNLFVSAETDFDDDVFSAGDASYQVTDRLSDEIIDYGVRYINDISLSKSTTQISGTNTLDPQVINYLEVPTSSVMKVVNWTYSSPSGWTTQTLTKLATDFESNNPGWVVLAGINGDFFDINSNGNLPKQTSGAAVNNGEVVRAVSSGRQVGFTNDGTTNSLIGGKNLQFTDCHYLTIYDENENEIQSFEIDKFNEAPTGDEIAVYFSYYTKANANDPKLAITPSSNSYIVEAQERGYATSSSKMYGRGQISSINKELELYVGQFAVVTENAEVQSLLDAKPIIRIQQNIIGDYADCDNISGCGAQLVLNGEYVANSDNMSHYRHPRTVIGKKADGSIVMVTVDGRQADSGMYGMTYDELSAMMMYYGVEEAYNLDGGGSTTMIIRNGNGGFDVKNTPSDGGERHDANGIFVIVPEMKVYIDKVTDKTLEFSYLSKCKDVSISNVEITLECDGYKETRKIDTDEYLWDNLIPNKDYTLVYSYDIEYEGNILKNVSNPQTFSTGKARPTLSNYSYTETDTHYVFKYTITDTEKCLTFARLKYDRKSVTLDANSNVCYLEKSKVTTPEFTIVLAYNVGANPSSSDEESYVVKLEVEQPDFNPSDEPSSKCGKKNIEYLIATLTAISLLVVLKKKNN